MSKTHLDIYENHTHLDVLVSDYYDAIRDEEGNIIWTKKQDSICKVRKKAHEVILYLPIEGHQTYKLVVSANAIKKIATLIAEIELQESEEFFED